MLPVDARTVIKRSVDGVGAFDRHVQWRAQKIFIGGGFIHWYMVFICLLVCGLCDVTI